MFDNQVIETMVDDARQVWPDNWPEIEKHFNLCCFSISVDVIMKHLGLFQKKDESATLEEIKEKVQVFKDAEYVLLKMLEILCEEDVLEKKDNQFTCKVVEPDIKSPAECLVRAVRDLPQEGAAFQWLSRGYGGLVQFIKGKVYGEEVMYPWSSFELVEDVYFTSNVYGFWSKLAGKAVKRVIESQYDGKVTVLEVGAGTGNGTYNVFENIGNVGDYIDKYIFTDISKALIKKASKNDYFKKFDFIDYKPLDATKDLSNQGIEEGQADILLAVNVLHATDNLIDGCKTFHKLIKDGGYVILGEIAPPPGRLYNYMELTFGLLASYYQYEDKDVRPDCPIVRPDQWIELFKEAGFSDVVAIPHNRLEGCDRGGVIIAKK